MFYKNYEVRVKNISEKTALSRKQKQILYMKNNSEKLFTSCYKKVKNISVYILFVCFFSTFVFSKI